MFAEYEESLEWFLQQLSSPDPDFFTDADWALVRTYTRSDGCTRVPDWHVKACWEHDFYFRTHHDFRGQVIGFVKANALFRRRIQRLSRYGIFDILSYTRWLGVTLFGRHAWIGQQHYRGF